MSREAFMELPAEERVGRTRSALAKGVPLFESWLELDPAVSVEWSPRAAQAAIMLEGASSVADLGCGHMQLKRYLRPDQFYVPVDLVGREVRTIVFDFNRDRLPHIDADYFAALGLLEYIYDIDGFLRDLRVNFVGGVASFFTRNGTTESYRVSNGWVNHHTLDELRSLLIATGFGIYDEREWRKDHYLFLLK